MSNDKKHPENEPIEVSREELEELKRDMRSAQLIAWAEANSQKIIGGLVALVLVIVGISLWKENRESQRASAAMLYTQALNAAQEDRSAMLQTLIKDYDNTVYGGLGRLLLVNADPEHAADYLQALLGRSDVDEGIRMQARLDLAELKIKAGDKDEANKLLAVRGGADYEQLRHYLMAEASADAAARIEHLKKARDAESHDDTLSQHIEQELASLEPAAAGQQ